MRKIIHFDIYTEGKEQRMKNAKLIFISHSTRDKALARIIVELAVACGVLKGDVFCSSYRGTDVKQQIPPEIKEALMTSKLDIVILSNDYKESTYCLNEAGIIWYKNDNLKLIVSIPGIFDELSAGFISTDYKQFRLENDNFCTDFFSSFYDAIHKLGINETICDFRTIQEKFSKQINQYLRQLPIAANLSTSNKKLSSEQDAKLAVKKAQSNIRKMFSYSYMQLHQQPIVFYEHYTRYIELKAIETGKMVVKTTTDCTIANLSNTPHTELFSSQFLHKDGGFNTFSDVILIDGKATSFNKISETPSNCPYIINDGPEIVIKPHKIVDIEYITSYEISPERFFQSKLIKIPCGNYNIRANFDSNFLKIMKKDYIFRFQIIPCVPRDLSYGVVPISQYAETKDKHFVSYSVQDGFPAGGGYVLTINKN